MPLINQKENSMIGFRNDVFKIQPTMVSIKTMTETK